MKYAIAAILLQSASFLTVKHSTQFPFGAYPLLVLSFALALLFARALVWQMALKIYDLEFIYPLTSFTPVVVLFLGSTFFGEEISTANVAGLIAMVAGAFLILREGNG